VLPEQAAFDMTTVTSVVASVTLPGTSTAVTWTFTPIVEQTTADYLVVERFFTSPDETALTGVVQIEGMLLVNGSPTWPFWTTALIQARR
jgi:hypothetical protein